MSATAPVRTRSRRAVPLRLTRYEPDEDTLQASTADLLWRVVMPPAEWAAYPAGHIKLTGQQKAKLYRMGLKPNWPDFMVSYNGMLGIELKTASGRLSIERDIRVRDRKGNIRLKHVEGQREVFPRLEASGGFTKIVVCRSLDEVIAELMAFGVPLRSHVVRP